MMKGSCLCGKVKYEALGEPIVFQYCHCSRCRKFTGSAYAPNIIVRPEQFRYVAGEQYVKCFQPQEAKHFATAFCSLCGSSLPWRAKTGRSVVIPAGSLDEHQEFFPTQNVFYESKAKWSIAFTDLPRHAELPKNKPAK